VVVATKVVGPLYEVTLDCAAGVPLVGLVTRSAARLLALEPGTPIVATIAADAVHLVSPHDER
jgi:molybdopterin-binding protein